MCSFIEPHNTRIHIYISLHTKTHIYLPLSERARNNLRIRDFKVFKTFAREKEPRNEVNIVMSRRDAQRRVAKDAAAGAEDKPRAAALRQRGSAGGIENSNTTAIKLNNEESGRSKYEHGYDLRPRKPVHNE